MYPRPHYKFSSGADDEVLTALAKAVYYWLNFTEISSRTDLLLESSLRYAIAEFTERRIHQTCFLEIQHPAFESRPMDFVWLCKDKIEITENGEKKEIDINEIGEKFNSKDFCENAYVLECKYAYDKMNNPHQRQDIFDDLCRLYYVLKECPKAKALFMLAGDSEIVTKRFEKSKVQTRVNIPKVENAESNVLNLSESLLQLPNIEENKIDFEYSETVKKEEELPFRAAYKDWFSFDYANRTKAIDTIAKENIEYYQTFKHFYDKGNCDEEISFQTRLIAYIKQDVGASFNVQSSQMVAIWQIESCENANNS